MVGSPTAEPETGATREQEAGQARRERRGEDIELLHLRHLPSQWVWKVTPCSLVTGRVPLRSGEAQVDEPLPALSQLSCQGSVRCRRDSGPAMRSRETAASGRGARSHSRCPIRTGWV